MKNKLPYAFYSCGFVFHKSWCSQRVCRVLATSMLQTTCLGFCSGRLFIRVSSSSPASGPEDWQMSFRLKMCLTTVTATSGCWHLLVSFPLSCSWVFHLMFSNSPQSQRNMVWAEIMWPVFCGDHLISIIHSLIYLPLMHTKSLNFTPTPMQWFSPPLPQAS